MSILKSTRRTAAIAGLVTMLLPVAAQAYDASCAGGQVVRQLQCVASGDYRSVTDPGTAGFFICGATNGAPQTIQYDYQVVWGGRYRYVCSHYHSCAEIQSVDPQSYAQFCN